MRYVLILSWLISFSCNNHETAQPGTGNDSSSDKTKQDQPGVFKPGISDSVLAAKIEDTLMKLSFVKESNAYIDSFSNHSHGMAFITDTAQGKVTVMAGYNGTERFETYYNFIVDPKTFEIKVLDPGTGDYVSVLDYIKNNKQ